MKKKSVKIFFETFDFSKIIEKSPRLIQEFLDGEIKFLKKYIQPNEIILDVGCGYGRLLKLLSKNAKRVVGIDFSESLLEHTKQNLAGKDNVELYLMRAERMDFDDERFDYVLCLYSTFGNMPGIELDVLKEMKRVCKKGGEIIISVFSENAKEVQIENYKRAGLTNIRDDREAIHTEEGLYSRRFTKKDLEELFEKVGLRCDIIKICPINYMAIARKT